MKKKIGIIFVLIAAGILGGVLWHEHAAAPAKTPAATAPDPQAGTYVIEGTSVTLAGGSAESPAAPGSASMIDTRYFGNEATGDLNGDGIADEAFIITQSGGGSGTFFYVAALLSSPSGYTGTNAMLLGDRIAPQTTEIKDGEIVVNYADRADGQPMSAAPSVGVTKYFKVQDGSLVAAP